MALGLLEPVVTKVIELIDQEVRFLDGVTKDVQLLRDELLIIKPFLEKVEPKHKDEKVEKQWFSQIRDAAYEAEDAIETYIFEVAQEEQRIHGFRGAFKCWILCTKQLPTLHVVGSKIQAIRQRLNQISINREKYRLEHINKSEASSSSQSPFHAERRQSSMEDERDPVGMESEAKVLVGQLLTGDANNSIVSLTGMGGIGKTTLARRIYNDHSVREHFPYRSWVTVSKSFFLRGLLEKIMLDVNYINKQDEEGMKMIRAMNEQELRAELSKYLSSRRYLVVLDDVWNIKDWDLLKQAFPLVDNESKVMLTSRSKEVGMHANPRIPPCEMRFLNEKEAWDLFCKKVFMEDEVSGCPSDLEELGKKIVGKCGGLPLAVAVLGGILRRREKLLSEWQALLKCMKWELFEGETQIREILALSYSDLPSYLKPCFIYLSVFPEDFEISASKLILLWIAEGFIEKRGEATKEETGEEYLKELIRRSLIQIKKLKYDGRVKLCHIHDLLREFCILEAREANFAHVLQGHDEVDTVRGMSVRRQSIIKNASIKEYVHLAGSSGGLRAFLAFADSYDLPKMECKHLFRGFRLLRVIDLVGVRITCLPKEIGDFIHLRYLGLEETRIKVFPSSMRRLRNLETLHVLDNIILEGLETLLLDDDSSLGVIIRVICSNVIMPHLGGIRRMPSSVWELPQLRHLTTKNIGFQGVPESNRLQTLRASLTSHELDRSFGNLIHLKELDIQFDKIDSQEAELLSNSIARMEDLRSLQLRSWQHVNLSLMHLAEKKFLTKLVLFGRLDKVRLDGHDFPPQLTRLRLQDSGLTSDPFEVLQHLPNLRTLKLIRFAYEGSRLVCSAGGFPRLEFLALEYLHELEEWEVEEGALPRLTHIRIIHCQKLRMLPEGFRHITTLNKLELIDMKNEFNARVKAEGEDYYKIQHVASLIVERPYD